MLRTGDAGRLAVDLDDVAHRKLPAAADLRLAVDPTSPSARTPLASAPDSTRLASLRNCPSRIESSEIGTSNMPTSIADGPARTNLTAELTRG